MLDEYKESQKIVYKTLINQIKNNKYSHAYLFETNGNPDAFFLVLGFVKALLCPYNYTNNSKCKDCSICHRIDNNIFSDLKIIEPDGLWIKKEQLDNLQKEFSIKSIESNKKIYIINNAEKLNTQAANSMLKFLEEPEEGIIAILITNNVYQLLSTIVSRCQVISLSSSGEKQNINLNIDEEELNNNLQTINNFVKYLEKEKLNTIIMSNKLWHEFYKERKDYINGFELLLIYYKDVLNYKLNRNLDLFSDYIEDIKVISENCSFNNLIYKINKVIELKENVKVNANQNLLLDKLIIELSRGDKYE